MRLTPQRSYSLLEKHACFVSDACDKCGQILGLVRFTRSGERGVWCSGEFRDGAGAHRPGTCRHCKARLPEGKRRGAVFCDDACRKAANRQSSLLRSSQTEKLSRTKPANYAAFSLEKSRDGRLARDCSTASETRQISEQAEVSAGERVPKEKEEVRPVVARRTRLRAI